MEAQAVAVLENTERSSPMVSDTLAGALHSHQ
jgi:hypothetical protein